MPDLPVDLKKIISYLLFINSNGQKILWHLLLIEGDNLINEYVSFKNIDNDIA